MIIEIDPEDEDRYWRAQYEHHQYYGRDYDEFQPAFQYGWESAARPEFQGKKFEEVEDELRRHWSEYTGSSRTDWDYMRWAVRDAYNRIQRRLGMAIDYKPPESPPEWENIKGNQYNSKTLDASRRD